MSKVDITLASPSEYCEVAEVVAKSSNYSEKYLSESYKKENEFYTNYKCLVIKKDGKICGCVIIFSDNYDLNTVYMHSFVIDCPLNTSELVAFYKKILVLMDLNSRSQPRLMYSENILSKSFITAIRKKRYYIYQRFLETAGYKVTVKKRFRFWPLPFLITFILEINKR